MQEGNFLKQERVLQLTRSLVDTATSLGVRGESLALLQTMAGAQAPVAGGEPGREQGAGEAGELSELLERLYGTLDRVMGGSTEDARKWLVSENGAFGGLRPLEVMEGTEGVAVLLHYLEAYRGG